MGEGSGASDSTVTGRDAMMRTDRRGIGGVKRLQYKEVVGGVGKQL